MVTTKEAAPAVRLNADWQAKYRQRSQQLLLRARDTQALQNPSTLPSVCVVGRCGVGKSTLINHLLERDAAFVSHAQYGNSYMVEQSFDFHGLFCIREIPGYTGWHAPETSRRKRFRKQSRGSSHDSDSTSESSRSSHTIFSGSSHGDGSGKDSSISSRDGSSHGKGRQLKLDEFVETYKIFEADTNAIIFVLTCRITPDDEKLLQLAVEKRKFFCIVRTHSDHLVKVTDKAVQKERLKEEEERLRTELSLLHNLEIRIFFLSISHTESVNSNGAITSVPELHFPLLQAYLSKPRGFLDELQIYGFVKEEVANTLEPYTTVKKRHQALAFVEDLLAGTLLPFLGPVALSFLKTLRSTLKACSEVGIVEDADAAIELVNAKKYALSGKMATKEGLMAGVQDSMIYKFGKIVFEVAIVDLVSIAAEEAFNGALPLVGPCISAASLPGRAKKIGEKLAQKACMLHELWIMQNISGLLETGEN